MGSPADEDGRNNNEGPQHDVTIGAPFAIGKTEVTFEEYDYFAGATNREKPNDNGWGRGARPVINVNWEAASAYCAWLSKETGKIYRLPSEAEWEYGARAGTTTPFSFGGTITTDQVNYNGHPDWRSNREGVSRGETVPAGSLPANDWGLHEMHGNVWGLHEMHGNVWEWVEDWYHNSYEGVPYDASAWLTPPGAERVLRGGSWGYNAWLVRSAIRRSDVPGGRGDDVGFRCAGVQEQS